MEEIRLLGPVELRAGGVALELGSLKERCVLAILAIECGRAVSAETLETRIWGQDRPPRARTTLTSYLSRLRGRFRQMPGGPSPLIHGAGGYTLNVDLDLIDLHRFRRLRRRARAIADSGDDDHALTLLAEAEGLWRGRPLAGLPGDWLRNLRESLEEESHAARVERIDLQLRLGRHGEVIGELHRLAAARPYDEGVLARLMTALYRHDRAAEALEVYRRADRLFAAELGSPLGPHLRTLHEGILRRDPGLDMPLRNPCDESAHGPHSLPEDIRDFTGRERELEALTEGAGSGGSPGRVTVITGMAGVGKSALALRAAHLLSDRYPDAQLYLPLCGHDTARPPLSAGAALAELLRMLGVPPTRVPGAMAERARLWRREMAGRRAVVVLDDATGLDQIAPIVGNAPSCRVLVTSRRRLAGLPAASYVHVGALSRNESRELVVRIAGENLDAAETDAVVRRCGGLPLALRLTAALSHRGVPAPVEPDDPLHLDDGVARAAFDLSYRALAGEQRRLFRRLGLSPCTDLTVEAAAALGARPIEAVRAVCDALLDHHLLYERAPGRMRMHDLVRAYARARACAEDSSRDRRKALSGLLRYYLTWTDNADRVLHPHRRRRALPADSGKGGTALTPEDADRWMKEEWSNGLALAEYAIGHELKHEGALLVHAFSPYLETHGLREQAAQAQEAAVRAARETRAPDALARALFELTLTRFRTGHYAAALEHANEALAIYRSSSDRQAVAETLDRIGIILWTTARYREALAHYQEAQVLCRKVDDRHGEAGALGHAGIALWHLGRYEEALRHLRFSLEVYRRLGDRRGEAMVLNNIGEVQRQRGFHRDAIRSYRESSAIFERIEGLENRAILKNNVGNVHQYKGDHPAALQCYREAIVVFREIGDRRNIADTLNSIGVTYLLSGRPNEALVHHEQAREFATDIGDPYQHLRALRGIADACQADCRYKIALGHYREALAIARDISDPYQEAKIHEGIASTVLQLHGKESARIHWRQALDIFEKLGVPEEKVVALQLHEIDEVAS
ncbi:BTAD domain-containing putative transcriptional regulator [Actinomadura viridis]|uniref:DNA-binding SARP family transcriptional activator/Tfp pilus assembly protein PilF n=1 Tax=Actinomadura viridis TaxID=58110 RepID=A0A931DVN1_9ACTN|nr:tetratricopeptide repeat protein [Actinomadura viridis]MBG6093563.1 DNA-binding SARP family transcriptional activator/Tfp pilus assembly protein PilF [Actinomadura viridis]